MRTIITLVTVWLAMSPCSTFAAAPPDGGAPQGFAAPERAAAGVSIGATSNGNALMGGGGAPEVRFGVETPFRVARRIRFDASRSSWTSTSLHATDRITLRTFSLSIAKIDHWSDRTAVFAGLGVGAYRYGYERTPLEKPWRGGGYALAGFEVLNSAGTGGVTFEGRVHAASGARQDPYLDYTMFKVDAMVGVKRRF
jgi:hypothetical protein